MPGVTYIILAAVEHYNEAEDFPQVAFATKDAEDLNKAFLNLKYPKDDILLLINSKATKTSIIQSVKKITKRATTLDSIIFYFAGHGCYRDGKNYLAPVDGEKTDIKASFVLIDKLFKYFKDSNSKKITVFLDCCHSGPDSVDLTRKIDDTFSADELMYQYNKEEYCMGFAACKSNQSSVSHPKLQNGVWTHFLIKALAGDAGSIYEKGLLFGDKLQSYLNKETAEFVKLNTTKKRDQTPIVFGKMSDRFIVADVNPIFDERELLKKAKEITFGNIYLASQEEENVKSLPGFDRKRHKEPSYVGGSANSFIGDISKDLIKDEIEKLSEAIRSQLNYKRKEVTVVVDRGAGSLETTDFEYQITIEQSTENAKEYVLIRKLTDITNPDLIESPIFNSIFAHFFDSLVIDLNNSIDVESLIDAIEDLDDKSIKVSYNHSDLSTCTIEIDSLNYLIKVTETTFSIVSDYKIAPNRLIEGFKEANKLILSTPDLKLLEDIV